MFCTYCGAENRDSGTFCQHCGKQLRREGSMPALLCKSCRADNPADANFCWSCGKRLQREAGLLVPDISMLPGSAGPGALIGNVQPSVGNIPMVQGTPQTGGMPMVQGTPSNAPSARQASSQTDSAAARQAFSQDGAPSSAGQALAQGASPLVGLPGQAPSPSPAPSLASPPQPSPAPPPAQPTHSFQTAQQPAPQQAPLQPPQQPQPTLPQRTASGGIKATGHLSRRTLTLGLVAVATVVVIVAGAVLLSVNHAPASTPEQTLTTFCNAVNSGDGHTAYDQLSTAAKSRSSEAQFGSNLHALTSQSSIINCTFKNVQQTGSTATATMFIGPEDPGNLGLPPSAPVHLVNENGVWKIDNGDNLQFSR